LISIRGGEFLVLRNLICQLESLSDELVIFATKDGDAWDLYGPAALVLTSDNEDLGTSLEELHYFLEVEIAKEVLGVWKQWRNERQPNDDERIEALLYYANNDAYLEPD
jgi:hypothetical protein